MNTTLKVLGLAIVLIGIAALFTLATKSDEITYVADIAGQVDALERDLDDVHTAIVSETLTPEKATAAKAQIKDRIKTINTTLATTDQSKLSSEQLTALKESLIKLNALLLAYSDSLVQVEALDQTPASNSIQFDSALITQVADTVDAFQMHVEEVSGEQITYPPPEEVLGDIPSEDPVSIDPEELISTDFEPPTPDEASSEMSGDMSGETTTDDTGAHEGTDVPVE